MSNRFYQTKMGVIMKYKDIVEWKRRIDFNMTYHETLVKLIGEAQKKGEKAQKELERLRRLSSKISKVFEKEGLLFTDSAFKNITLKHEVAVGIDGSRQLVGGVGGKWYVPISIARVNFPKDLDSTPKVDIFWAGIEEIQEQKDFRPEAKASVMMLVGETKAILNWGISNREALVFIDGPIVDPPFYSEKKYIKDRCDAIKKCLRKSLLIGCVKRSRDAFYIEHLTEDGKKKIVKNFPSDQHLMAYIFANLRYKGYYGPCFTKWIDVSDVNKIYREYKKNEIYIACTFFQKYVNSQVLRLDVPFLKPLEEDISGVNENMIYVAKATSHWTYPGQDYPIPVLLAHDKCNIREGCAEVLYEEIITRSRSVHPLSQTISTQLR